MFTNVILTGGLSTGTVSASVTKGLASIKDSEKTQEIGIILEELLHTQFLKLTTGRSGVHWN